MSNETPPKPKYAWIRVAGQCSFIPVYLALFPIAFRYIGLWLDGMCGTTWLENVFLFLGLISGARQTYFLIKNLIEAQDQ